MLNVILQLTMTAGADTVKNAVVNTPITPGLTPPPPEPLTLLELLWKGGPVMIPIGILFVMALYFFIERLIVVSRASKSPSNFIPSLKDFISGGNMDAAKALCMSTSSPASKMILKGIGKLGKPIKEIEQSMENSGKLELFRLERNLGVLGIIGRIAPMLGFIGTIVGVINIFYKIALANTVEIDVISEGLYQKMITSAGGLTVGIFAFACHYIIQSMVDRKAQAMEAESMEFLDIIQSPGR
ncbi:MAG: MotA/TolQ/ExbB proton channel family protein [Bacteroidia bacterium]|nr:MotA/TolQ/ExbB proton channel family protein [Bacteroidia bacterium]